MGTSGTAQRAVGVESVAGEHDIQLQLLGAVERAVSEGFEFDEVMSLLDQLIAYTDVHFHSEEVMMRFFAFPQYEAHRAEHAELMEEVRTMRDQFQNQDRSGLLEAVAALRSWLEQHLDGMDRGLITFLGRQAEAEDHIPAVKRSG